MRARRIVTELSTAEMLDAAVSSSALAVVTLQDNDERWLTFKCRFLERDPSQKFFVLDYEPFQGTPLPEVTPGQYVGISFRHKSRKVLFATVAEARGRFTVKPGESVSAIRYRWPESMTEMQRRAYYRTPVPDDAEVPVTLWAGGPGRRLDASAGKLAIVNGKLRDLSCGGALVALVGGLPADWSGDETLGCELHLPDGKPPLLLAASYRGQRGETPADSGLAIQFIGLELQIDGRHILQRLSRCVQQFHRSALVPALRSGSARLGL